MYQQDIAGSIAHARMLAHVGVLTEQECQSIIDGLKDIQLEIERGDFAWSTQLEDVHMNIEARLTDRIGAVGKKLHTGRSRNDQVATDLRLYLRDEIDSLGQALRRLQLALIELAEREADTIMPGFTHLQTAQPVTWGHHMMAYVEMFGRDLSRFRDARVRMNESPLGAAALAGTSFPIDREMTAKALGFDRPAANSLDAVADRIHGEAGRITAELKEELERAEQTVAAISSAAAALLQQCRRSAKRCHHSASLWGGGNDNLTMTVPHLHPPCGARQ